MKAQLLILIACVATLSLMSWSEIAQQPIDLAKWLIGTWENQTNGGSIYETWTRSDDNTFAGKSYKLNEGDTIIFETITLVQADQDLFYIPQVSDQNNGEPVKFTSSKVSSTELIFENPNHDFPQVISYTRVSSDSLVASISGIRNGEERKILFPMRRVE